MLRLGARGRAMSFVRPRQSSRPVRPLRVRVLRPDSGEREVGVGSGQIVEIEKTGDELHSHDVDVVEVMSLRLRISTGCNVSGST
jgi:hypothetical protein